MALPDFYSQWTQARQNGAQRADDQAVRQNIGGALQGDSGALAAILKASPQMGMQLQDRAVGQQKAALAQQQEDSGRAALMFSQTGNPQYYAAWRQSLAGLPNAPQLPEALEPDDLEPAKQSAGAYAQAYGGFKGMETPSAIRELQMLKANPELAKLDMERRQAGFGRPQLIETAQGYAWATPQGATPLNYGGGAATPESPQVQRALAMLAGTPGVQMTSGMRTPEHNREVGGVPNSQHLRGTAGDYAVPPEKKAAFIAQARQQGFEAIDEGDHVHLELPGRSAGGGQRVMPAPKQAGPSDFERKLSIAQSMGATPDQLKQMVMGESGGGKPSATQIKLANTAKSKLIDLTAIDNQLAQVEKTFQPLQNSYSAGPMIGGLIPSMDGKRFDAAVSLLQGMVRKLTRTPGEGAMSDYETKLAQLANPSRSEYESVTADQIQQLRALIKTTREGYEALLQDAGGNSANVPKPGQQAVKRARNPQTGETLVLVNGQWVPE